MIEKTAHIAGIAPGQINFICLMSCNTNPTTLARAFGQTWRLHFGWRSIIEDSLRQALSLF